MYNVVTKVKMKDRDLVFEFQADVKSGMRVKDIKEKYGMSYHVYRNFMEAFFGVEHIPCRRGGK